MTLQNNGNAASWFIDRHVEEGRSDKVAFREAAGQKREITYGVLSKRSDLVAGALEKAGFRREERLACLVLDQLEYPEIFWGTLKGGILPIALNTLLATEIYETILKDSRAAGLIVSVELLDVVLPAARRCADLRKIVVVGGESTDEMQAYDDFLADVTPKAALNVSPDERAFWLYSSGSTGQPKGVIHLHGSLRATAETYGAQVLGIREDDTVFSVAKIFFAYGLGNAMTFPLSVGATTVLLNGRPTPDVAMAIIRDEEPTIFCGVPTLYAATLATLGEGQSVPSKLRACISAGEALPEDVGKRWQEAFGVQILDGVGSTEMLHIFLSNRHDDLVYGTSGRAVPGYELRCVDEDDQDIGPGGVGELLVKGSSAAEGYWNQRDKSRATFQGEWIRTGDKYEITEDGRFIYCGRTDDMFKVSGIWVSPFEIEQALIAYPDVIEAAVIAARDDEGLEKPKAFVVLKPEAASAEVLLALKEFVKEKIGKWKYPRWIECVEDLPKTATGKIQRFKLRQDL